MLLARLRGEAPSTGAQKRVKTLFKCAACEGHGKRGLMTTGYFLLHKECPVCGGGGKNQEALKSLGPGKCTKCNAQGTRGLFTSRSCCFSFLCKPCAGSGFTQHYKLYHGTDRCTSEIIKQYGFRPSPDGMFGKGIYVSGDAEKAAWFADDRAKRRNKTAVVLVLDVDVGRCKVIDATACSGIHKEGCECKLWLEEEYESQYVAAGKGVNREETVLRHPRQISVVGEI